MIGCWWQKKTHRRSKVVRRRTGRLQLEVLEDRTVPSVCTVDRLTDMGEGADRTGDLRYCINQAADGDRITFDVTGTINLTGALPDLTRNISIEGPGASLLTVRRFSGSLYRIFTVGSEATVLISGLAVTFGRGTQGAGILNAGTLAVVGCFFNSNSATAAGGAIYNSGTLTVSESTISSNGGTTPQGGGIYNAGTLSISHSTISGNFAGIGSSSNGLGAGVYNAGNLTVSNSTLSGNTAGGLGSVTAGGGIYNSASGNLVVGSSTLTGNLAQGDGTGLGGGIYNDGTLTASNSTLSGNRAGVLGAVLSFRGQGGGIYNSASGTLTVGNSTLTGNRAVASSVDREGGGGLFINGGAVAVRNTILAGNTATVTPDLAGSLTASGYNLVGNSTGGGGFDATDLLDVAPLLGPLQDNGGPTRTHALLPGSPALDAGDNTDAPDTDQRGLSRIVAGRIDIGAFEVQIGAATRLEITVVPAVLSGVPFDVVVRAVDAYGHTATGYTGTVTFTTSDPDPGVVLPAAYTFTTDDQGVHTFSGEFLLMTVGDQTLTATDPAGGLTSSILLRVE